VTDPNGPGDFVAVGRVGPARGVRGEVFVEPWTDAPDERFAPGSVLVTEPASAGPLTVEAASRGGGKQVVRFVGCADRPSAEALRGVQLLVPASARPELTDPEEFYDSDLVGLSAVTVGGEPLGPVREVQHAGGASYLVVSVAGQDRLVPFVRAIVPEVDVAGGTVTIDAPPGLFEV
jgi:16S rRNA processing protein RimM